MSGLFDVSVDNIGLHLNNLYEEGELLREATTEESSVVQIEGTRKVRRLLTLYNLDAILAVGLSGALTAKEVKLNYPLRESITPMALNDFFPLHLHPPRQQSTPLPARTRIMRGC